MGDSAIQQSHQHHTHHHHHHHHHHSSRHRRLRKALKDGALYGVCVVAVLCMLMILKFGMAGNDNLEPALLAKLPLFVLVGLAVCAGNYLLEMYRYYKEHRDRD